MRVLAIVVFLILGLSACVPAESANTLDNLSGRWEPQGISESVFERLELEQQGRILTGKAYHSGALLGEVSGEIFQGNFVFTVRKDNGDYYEMNGSVYDIYMSGLFRYRDSRDRIISNGTFRLSWKGKN